MAFNVIRFADNVDIKRFYGKSESYEEPPFPTTTRLPPLTRREHHFLIHLDRAILPQNSKTGLMLTCRYTFSITFIIPP